jgi:CheY-like chemotaxis protein
MATILVADDSAADRHLIDAAGGREALAAIGRQVPDLVLTDLHMPGMDGLELVREVRDRHPHLPVILITAYGSEELAIRALPEGAASYVPKRNLAADLLPTVHNVLALAGAAKDQQRVLGCLTQTESQFVLDNDETLITPLIGYLEADLRRQEFCIANGLLRLAVALREALINAIHHGNLEVPSVLLAKDERAYSHLVEERRRQAPYRERRLHVTAKLTAAAVAYVIADEGPGFDPSCLPDPTDPANLENPSGRGLLLIRTFMDSVSHSAGGNQITMIKRCERGQ